MNASFTRWLSLAKWALIFSVCMQASCALAHEDAHPHAWVTVTEYLGHNHSQGTYDVHVTTKDGREVTILLHDYPPGLKSIVGKTGQGRITVYGNTWRYFACEGYRGAVPIHAVRELR